MEKVKVTREIADAIERGIKIYSKSRIMNDHEPDGWLGNLTDLNGLTKDEMARSLYIGYEVEPEYKENDWLNYLTIHGDLKTDKVIDVSDDRVLMELSNSWVHFNNVKSHATPSEIAKEKERRFFAEHGREPWELKKNDILNDRRENCTVTIAKVIDKEVMTVLFTNGDWEFYNNIVEDSDWRVACFADKRLDVKTNE